MLLHRWATSRELSKLRRREIKRIHDQARIVIQHPQTCRKMLSDFASVNNYLLRKFPTIDLSDVKLYLAEVKVMDNVGWSGIGGCYIATLQSIIVKKKINSKCKSKSKFARLMHEYFKMKTHVEDVVVHEFIHAVSHKLNRSSKQYCYMEEEFVYTNCVDFYKEKGMLEEDIVNNNFLPFCLQDVQNSQYKMNEIYLKTNHSLNDVLAMSQKEREDFYDTYAEIIVKALKLKSQELGHHMIDLYKQYGENMYQMQQLDPVEDISALRFSSLDLEES